jgi:hypothetical protein
MTQATEQLPEGWTFIVNSLTVSAGDSYAVGWFVYYKMTVGGEDRSEESLDMEYLTPFDTPTRLNIPRKLFGSENSAVDLELGPKELYAGLKSLFALGYGSIPKARTDIPMHNIPPSRRDAINKAQRPWENNNPW